MTDQNPDITAVVREALLAAFGEIGLQSGLATTHLDMRLRLDDGTHLQAQYRPITEGGSATIEIELGGDWQRTHLMRRIVGRRGLNRGPID